MNNNENNIFKNQKKNNKKHNLTIINTTNHLNIPTNLNYLTKNTSQSTNNSTLHSIHLPHPKNTPKIAYNLSEKTLNVNKLRNKQSPQKSPKLRKQPTIKTNNFSIINNTNNYIQLNQYKLKNKINKIPSL